MVADASESERAQRIAALSDRLVSAQRPLRVLDAVYWNDQVEAAFFAAGAREQPPVDAAYYAGRPLRFEPSERRATLDALIADIEAQLGRYDPAAVVLTRQALEYASVIEMLEARGTPAFGARSAALYGAATEHIAPGVPSLAEVARSLTETLGRLDARAKLPEAAPPMSATDAAAVLQARFDEAFGPVVETGGSRVHVTADGELVADAAAGGDHVRVRAGATFDERTVRLLEVHEGWVHVGTTQNGARQRPCAFLGKGPPSATLTQEGLAVFTEVLTMASFPARVRRVDDRVRAIAAAEQGATFLDVFRMLRDADGDERGAYATAARTFRGSVPTGKPFTKDLAYVKGFVETYAYVQSAIRRGVPQRVHLLFAGKVALRDANELAELFDDGLIEPPAFVPPPFRDLSALSAWMCFSGMLSSDWLHTLGHRYSQPPPP
ncbi:MAG: DUF1704 domain-containing protein [Myxococcales bacterium]|nr:DUF1704 domain-containing protein [Myxococcales bacterium]